MSNLKEKKTLSRIFTGVSLVTLIFALNVTGALWGFWRTIGSPNPTEFLFGAGNDGTTDGYGYGYGYGYGDFNTGYATSLSSSSSSGGGGGGWSSSSSSSGSSWSSSSSSSTSSSSTSSSSSGEGSSSSTSSSSTSSSSSGEGSSSSTSSSSGAGSSSGNGSSSSSSGGWAFTDTSNSWAVSYIDDLAEAGIVQGNEEGAFEPDRNITRTEFLKMVLRAFGHTYDDSDSSSVTFDDVDTSHWTANVIGRAQELWYVDGVGGGNFRPNDIITRAEAMKMLLNSASIAVDPNAVSSFDDVSGWAVKYVEKALELGIVAANSSFRPEEAITRAESAKVIVRAMEL